MQNINIGDIVSLKIKKKIFKTKGEVLDLYFIGDIQYITIYSFFKRKPETFIINEKKELEEINNNNFSDIENRHSPVIYELSEKEKKHDGRFLFKTIAFLTLIIFIISIFDDIKYPFFVPHMGYDDFLKKKYNIKELYLTVRNRLDYVYDYDDFWQTPEDAWKNKKGDCEEFASIIADYLSKHNITNYLVGMNTSDNKGHAVVFAVLNNVYYMIDPTRAIELTGVAKLDKINSLKEAVRVYSDGMAFIYSVPKFNGDKNIVDKVK